MPQTFNVGARSLFVTTTAWVFIALAALACLSALVQHATLASWAPGVTVAGDAATLPGLSGLLADYLPWVVATGLSMSIATLACAVGLLLRLEWARRSFIGLLAVAIVANLLGLWLQHELLQSIVQATLGKTALPASVAGVVGGFVIATRVMAAAVVLAACLLLAWVMRRLMSPAVRQEFA